MGDQIASYKKNGYLLLKGFFDKEAIARILADAKNVFLKQFKQKGFTRAENPGQLDEKDFNEMLFRLFREDIGCLSNCGKQAQHLVSLHQLSLHEKIISRLRSLGLSTPVISTRPVLYFNHPRLARQKVFHTVDAHQDWRSMQGSLNAVVAWLPLIDINSALGALEIIPGSHLRGLLTSHIDYGFGMVEVGEAEQNRFEAIEVEAGDILFFSSFLIHKSGNNSTERPRWSCHFRYNDLDELTFKERGYVHPYIYKPAEELLTPGFPTADQVKKIFED